MMDWQLVSTVLSPVFASALTYVFARNRNRADIRKVNVEVDGAEIENMEKALKIWKLMVDDLSIRISALRKEIEELRIENRTLLAAMKKIEDINVKLVMEIKKLEALLPNH